MDYAVEAAQMGPLVRISQTLDRDQLDLGLPVESPNFIKAQHLMLPPGTLIPDAHALVDDSDVQDTAAFRPSLGVCIPANFMYRLSNSYGNKYTKYFFYVNASNH